MKHLRSVTLIGVFVVLFFNNVYGQFPLIRYYSPSDSNVALCNGMNKFYTFVAGKVYSPSHSWDMHVMRYFNFSGGSNGPYILSTDNSEEPVALSTSRFTQYFYVTILRTDSAGNTRTQLVKYFEDGTRIWDTVFGHSIDTNDMPIAVSFDQSRSRLYIVSELKSGGNSNFLTRSIDTSGNVVWSRMFDLKTRDVPAAITNEGNGIFVTGTSYDQQGIGSIVTLKYDTTGTLQWNRVVSRPSRSLTASDISSRSLIAVCGNDSGETGFDIVTLLYSNDGDSLWQRSFDGSADDYAAAVKLDFNSNVVVAGTSYRDSVRGNDMCLIKYFQNGDSSWVNFVNGPGSGNDSLTRMTVDGFNCIFITGRCPALNGYDAFGSALVNQAGWYHWTSFVQSTQITGDNIPYALSKFEGQNTFAISGTTFGGTANSYTTVTYLGVIDGIENNNLIADDFEINAFPNPFNPTATISFRLETTDFVKLNIYDITGRHIETLINGIQERGNHEMRFDASNLSTGTYFATLEAGSKVVVRKLVLVK